MTPDLIRAVPTAGLGYDLSHLLSTLMLLLSFVLLYHRSLRVLVNAYALQAAVLALAAAWRGYDQSNHELYMTAVLAFGLKALLIPTALHKIIVRFHMHRVSDPALSMAKTMLAGVGVVTLALTLVLPTTEGAVALSREELSLALSIVLLGFLSMIVRRNALSQVVAFMSIENGLILAAVGVGGMPLIVELMVAFSVMVASIIFGIFFFHISERFETLDTHRLEQHRGDHR
jgi:hydrogenase-4 component E